MSLHETHKGHPSFSSPLSGLEGMVSVPSLTAQRHASSSPSSQSSVTAASRTLLPPCSSCAFSCHLEHVKRPLNFRVVTEVVHSSWQELRGVFIPLYFSTGKKYHSWCQWLVNQSYPTSQKSVDFSYFYDRSVIFQCPPL